MRAAILLVDSALLEQFLVNGTGLCSVASHPLPDDIKIVDARLLANDRIALKLTSEEFADLAEGEPVPIVTAPSFKRHTLSCLAERN